MRIVACLNGDRRPGAHPALPVSAEQVALDAAAAAAAGADEVHVHPRDGSGAEALEPQVLTPLLERLRAELPEVPVSVTTALTAEPDPWRRYDLVQRWGALPDSATVNLHEPGAVEVARLLADRRVRVEAGLATAEAARLLAALGAAVEFDRVLVEPEAADPRRALAEAERIGAVLDRAGIGLPRLLHGSEGAAWPVLDAAAEAGHDVRIGLEDTLLGPDGAEARDNAELVAAAVERVSPRARR
ncbi:3-keto-5-aminohexanoate cleavage protein [Nocardiopsis sp. RSe5-2]|uniref:3-keto-5-aminohexanoate cleavage protein n=1 Tax=Nocardiopsis endophytica TaxID=3018445 RepID=A0ABT4TY97_9ACTN|nr:3-keto-5-aminohexanoate cleavage protein [Nocardiopsis endophytica]MDA2809669.1 3-keto-5-aminohexanoate cleavage protein [Nocardiopsis endophytica]